MFTISDHRDETPTVKTVRFEDMLIAVPGQFVMVWVPGVDEFPMSVSYSGDRCGITYRVVGEGTKALSSMKTGERVGIRGPYGKGFSVQGKRLLLVAGGVGMACLAPFIELATNRRAEVEVVLGAKTKDELLFESRCVLAGAKVHLSTDDGSIGFRGLATDLTRMVADKDRFDCMYACGPEQMLVGILALSKEKMLPMQASLERLMKCGVGICDSCAIDGRHVCRDGPVFSGEELARFDDLGKSKLDRSGRKVPI